MNPIKNALPVVAAVGFGVWNAWYQLRDPLKQAAENRKNEPQSKSSSHAQSPEENKPTTGSGSQ